MSKKTGIDLKSIFKKASKAAKPKQDSAVFVFLDKKSLEKDKNLFVYLKDWQKDAILAAPWKWHRIPFEKGPQFLCWFDSEAQGIKNEKSLEASPAIKMRDLCGSLFVELEAFKVTDVEVEWSKKSPELESAFMLGMELAAYRFTRAGEIKAPQFNLKTKSILGETLGQATNLARHLVNLPSNQLHPQSYAQAIQALFSNQAGVKVDVWDEKKLKAENMNLLLAVGGAAEFGPRLVHIRYRPKTSKEKQPWAFVGKGITFDSGGLDIKPPSAMRWMKKDMGGSAAVVGFAWWVIQSKINQAMDFYLPLAENAVAAKSFRPGDVITSRSGLDIEIHNTDAEGRLVMADALDVAVNQSGKDKASLVIDVATLTGAIKVGLGAQLAGLFSNDEKLRDELFQASSQAGDWSWPMPLFQDYRQSMSSPIASMTNAVDGFGGAITAGLFLESFVDQRPWAHIDIYAWKDGASGAYLEPGGNGQGVQLLAQWTKKRLKI